MAKIVLKPSLSRKKAGLLSVTGDIAKAVRQVQRMVWEKEFSPRYRGTKVMFTITVTDKVKNKQM